MPEILECISYKYHRCCYMSCHSDGRNSVPLCPNRCHSFPGLPFHTNLACSCFCLSQIASFFGTFRLAWTLKSYNASLNANRNAAVITLCVIFGPIPTATPTLASPLPLPVENQTRTFIQPAPPLFADTPPQAPHHPLRLPLLITSDMHPAFHRNIRIRNPRRQQLPHRPQEEHIQRLHLPPSLQHIPQLLEDRILQYRVHNQHQRRQHARKKCRRAFVSKKREEGRDCSWFFRGRGGLECGEFLVFGGGG